MASYFNTEADTLLSRIRSNTPPNPIYSTENEMHKIARAAIIQGTKRNAPNIQLTWNKKNKITAKDIRNIRKHNKDNEQKEWK